MAKDFRRNAKVLIFDLEVSPRLVWTYGHYKTTPIKVEMEPVLLAMSWKWLGEKGKPHGETLLGSWTDNLKKRFLGTPVNDRELVKQLWNLLDEAEVVVAHNGRAFDNKMANTFFLRWGMTPPSPYKVYDTLQTARKFFKFDDNRLDSLGQRFGGEGKTEETYKDCWYAMLCGSSLLEQRKAARTMDKYCRQDVVVLENLYNKLLPWATNHPNLALHAGMDYICPRCGHDSEFRVKSYRKTGARVTGVNLLCKHCGSYVNRPLNEEEKEELEMHGSLSSFYRNLSA